MARIDRDGFDLDPKEARLAILGYCFGKEAVTRERPTATFPEALRELRVRQWGYALYDGTPDPSPDRLEILDILLVDALNGQMNMKRLNRVHAVRDEVDTALSRIPRELALRDLPDPRVLENYAEASEGSAAQAMWQAWASLMSLPDVGIAITHKILHRKRPRLIPLLDGKTEKHLGAKNLWRVVYAHVRTPFFTDLAAWWEGLVPPDGAAKHPLADLRLHDILVWLSSEPEQWEAAVTAGEDLPSAGATDRSG